MSEHVEINPEWPEGLTWTTVDKHDSPCPACEKIIRTQPEFLHSVSTYEMCCSCEKGAILFISPELVQRILR
jgi:hypothetical protein